MSPAIAPGIAATLVGAPLTFIFSHDLVLGFASRRWLSTRGRIVGWGGHEGGLAPNDSMAAHGLPRATGDLDFWIRRSSENAARVIRALAAFGAPLDQITEADICAPDVVFQMGDDARTD